MSATRRMKFMIEASLAGLSGALALLTLMTPEWIEGIFEVNPDQHSGMMEWSIVLALSVVSIVAALAARSDWRRSFTSVVSRN